LANIIEEEGGVEKLIITHRDNCPDHERWKARFPALQRVIHRADAVLAANDCEVKLEAGGAWQVSSDVRVVHTPGHTAGSLCVLVATAGDTVLFTGDHLAYSATRKVRAVCTRWSAGVALATLHSSPCSHCPDSSVGVGRVQAVQPRQRGRASGVPPPPGRRRRLPLHVDPARPRAHGKHIPRSCPLLFVTLSVFTIMCVAHGTTWQARFGSVAEKDAAVRAAAAAFEREDAADGLFAVGYY